MEKGLLMSDLVRRKNFCPSKEFNQVEDSFMKAHKEPITTRIDVS